MKIGFKITLIAITGLLTTVICMFVGRSGLGELNDGAEFLKDVTLKNEQAAFNLYACYQDLFRFTAGMIAVEERIPRNLERIQTIGARIQEEIAFLEGNVRSEAGKEGVAKIRKAVTDAIQSRQQFVEMVSAGRIDEARALRFGGDYETNLQNALDAIEDFKANVTGAQMTLYVEETAPVAYDSAATILTTVTIIAVLVIAVLSIIIITGITKPLKQAVLAAEEVANGNLNVDLSSTAKDETGILLNSFERVVGVVNAVIKDTNDLSAACVAGRLEVRSDANKFKGAYKELVTGINKTLDAVIGPLNMTAEYVDRIAKGDIPPKITDAYQGDFNEIKNNINGCIEALNTTVKAINTAIHAAVEGNLKYRADVNILQGDYRKILEGANQLIEAFAGPVENVSVYMQGIAEGKESAIDYARKVSANYKGDFIAIKDAAEKLNVTLLFLLQEINNTSTAAVAGNLDVKADSSKLEGAWSNVLVGLNNITAAANSIITDAGKTLSIMSTGDLTPRVTREYPGKFGEMRNSINHLGDSLTDLISQLQEAVHTTASASAQISSTAETLAAATQEQSSQTDEVASAMEEMSRTVTDNAHSATKTADVAKHSGEVANNGGKVVKQTVDKMREIAAVVKTSADNIAKLGESSKKIGEIIGVIDDIADQTNLLSLNAAIEAARAGEQGRGFAVVADSVGKLAISTASATKEIADMIKGIQHDTESAVKAMEKGTSEVQSGIELADNAGHSLEDILAGINELLDMVNQIAAASEEQSATSEQISKNVSSISKVAADSARNIEDVASTANELARMTNTLTSLVSQFKVDHNPRHHHAEAGGGRYLD